MNVFLSTVQLLMFKNNKIIVFRTLFLLFLFIGIHPLIGNAQITNDDCSTAIPFANGNFDFDGSTSSGETSRCLDVSDYDAWFTFTAPTGSKRIGSYTIINTSKSYNSGGGFTFAVYSGTCGNLTEFFCSYNNSGTLNIMGLNTSDTYYLRISPSTDDVDMNLDLLSYTADNSPANDDCVNSENIVLTTSSQNITAAAEDALMSDTDFPSCEDKYFQYDMWYDFTTSSSGNVLIEFDAYPNDNTWEFTVYEGSCGSLTEVECEPMSDDLGGGFNKNKFLTLNPNQNYFMRVWDQRGNDYDDFTFDISAGLDIQNGSCGNREVLPVQTECTISSSTQLGFGGQWTEALPSCDDFNNGGLFEPYDVWYEFDAPNSGSITVPVGDEFTKVIYSGTCGSLVEVGCKSGSNEYFSGLTPGNTYILRIMNNDYDDAASITDVCIIESIGPTTNDDCVDAITIPVTTDCSVPQIANFYDATASGVASQTCYSSNLDIWFSFSPSATGAIKVETEANIKIGIYSESCGSLEALSWCMSPTEVISGLDPSEIYYLQLLNENEPIEFCLLEATGPMNNFCFNSQQIDLNSDCQPILIDFTNTNRSTTGIAPCDQNSYDRYYNITVPSNGKIRTGYLSHTGTQYQHAISILSGECNNLNLIQCVEPVDGIVDLTGLTSGDELIVRVASSSKSYESEICLSIIPDPPSNDLCINPTSLSLSNSSCNLQLSGTMSGATNNIDFCVTDKNDVFYSFTAPANGNYEVKVLNNTYGLTIAASADCIGPSLECATNTLTLSLLSGETRILCISSIDNNLITDFDICVSEFETTSTDGNVGVGSPNPIQKLQVAGGIMIGNTTTDFPGSLRYTGQDIEGYSGGQWRSLTTINGDHLGNHTATETLDLNNNKISNLDSPTNSSDAANKEYVDSHTDGDASSSNEIQTLSINGNTLSISNGGSVIIPEIGASEWSQIQNIPVPFADGIDNVVDNDNDPTNEIETWSTLSGKPSGFADNVDNVNDGDYSSSNESISTFDFSNDVLKIIESGTLYQADFSQYNDYWTKDVSNNLRYFGGNITIGTNVTPTDKLFVANGGIDVVYNSSNSNAHLDIIETGSSDGARIHFKNNSSTSNLWTLYGRSSNTSSSNDFNLFHTLTGNIITAEGETGDVGFGGNPTSDLHIFQGNNGGADGIILQNSTNLIRMYTSSSNGNLFFFSNVGGTDAIATINDASGAYTALSDRRKKKNIKDLDFDWKNFMMLKPSSYQYIQDDEGKTSIGMIAQDIQGLYPELVEFFPEYDLYHLNYSGFGILAIKAIQEQQKTIQELNEKNEQQDEKIAIMEQKLEEMMEMMTSLKENKN